MFQLLAEAPQTEGSPWMNMLVLMLPMVLIFYFLLIRPQKKQEAQRRAMIAAIKKNDRILTNGGMYGVVTNVIDDDLVIRVDDTNKVKVRITMSAVAAVINQKDDEDKE